MKMPAAFAVRHLLYKMKDIFLWQQSDGVYVKKINKNKAKIAILYKKHR